MLQIHLSVEKLLSDTATDHNSSKDRSLCNAKLFYTMKYGLIFTHTQPLTAKDQIADGVFIRIP